jgi:UDP-N-acetylmuramoylalanine--D-glutamate ligase
MHLDRVIAVLAPTQVVAHAPVEISDLAYDAASVRPATLFFCVPGSRADGHDFAADAVSRGAVALVVERPVQASVPQLVVDDARAAMAPVAAELFGHPSHELPVAGVTGTNGKTTTCELLGEIFRAAGRPVAVAGNVGRPLTGLDGALAEDAWIVCELSSFQLEDIHELRPRIAVLLNITPDHLDRHRDLDAYRAAKLRIFENQGPEDVAVVPRGFPAVPGEGRRVEFAAEDPLPAEPRLPGEHNRENAAAATVAAQAAGIPDDAIASALASFAGVPHRLELVRELDGVRWVNDSKATNPDAAERALGAYPPGLRVILGGSRKGMPFAGLAARAREAGVARAYLIGESADEIAEALAREGVRFRHSVDLEHAVADAHADAERGEVVLLSPACASYDQFENFEERGARFRELVEAL